MPYEEKKYDTFKVKYSMYMQQLELYEQEQTVAQQQLKELYFKQQTHLAQLPMAEQIKHQLLKKTQIESLKQRQEELQRIIKGEEQPIMEQQTNLHLV